MPSYKNAGYIPLPDIKLFFARLTEGSDDVLAQVETPWITQIDWAINSPSSALKILHPVFFLNYRRPMGRVKTEKPEVLGLDIETDAKTGLPKLIGTYHCDVGYQYQDNPDLAWFARFVLKLRTETYAHLIAWGNLDLQCILRLFDPNEYERKQISRGITATISNGKIIGTPPVMRKVDDFLFYVSAYIPGRALKLGILKDDREQVTWLYNAHQFYPGTIARTAKGYGLEWIDFAKETHVIDWARYEMDIDFKTAVLESNKQDAKTVWLLSDKLLDAFYEVFQSYPNHLISTGSLCDAAVSSMAEGDDYNCQSMEWLARNIWAKNSEVKSVDELRLLCSEAFSAGYVDQFAIGYSPEIHHADISAAYPFQIRALHDLRYSRLVYGTGDVEDTLTNYDNFESAIIRGRVTIPETLKFHPITVKTIGRQNIRPYGTFWAAYTIEERRFCERFGATFEEEEYVIIVMNPLSASPLSKVSTKLGEYRAATIAKEKEAEKDSDTAKLLNNRQYLIKLIDNSLYGKTVMTTARVENDSKGTPEITGYQPGDRYNSFWGCLITARTRVLLASAAMAVESHGGTVRMAMTDSLFWTGNKDALPQTMIRPVKTPGFFEPVDTLQDFYLIKTGQYEYRTAKGWQYKLRGLPIQYEFLEGGTVSFYRKMLQEYEREVNFPRRHGADVGLHISTRRLMSIGGHDLPHLGALIDGETVIYPFRLGSKQKESSIPNWYFTLDNLLPLGRYQLTTTEPANDRPLTFLNTLYRLQASDNRPITRREEKHKAEARKKNYIVESCKITNKLPPKLSRKMKAHDLAWRTLEEHFGVERQ